MRRREFLASGLACGAAAAGFAVEAVGRQKRGLSEKPGCLPPGGRGRFRLNFAPHFGTFRHLAGDDPVDQVKFMADEGFTALEDNTPERRPRCVQKRIRREMDRHGMTMGLLAATADFGRPTFTSGRRDLQAQVLGDVTEALEVAERMNAKWMTVVPGRCDRRLPMHRQESHVVELLKRLCDLCEPAGRVLLLEPLDHGRNQSGLFLRTIPQARAICRAVDSPSCRILFDVYQQHVTAGKLSSTIETAWREIGYFQIGDCPGRKEPGTGSIDFRGLFCYLRERGYDGLVGMEHGNSQPGEAGERAVIDAYAAHAAAT